VQACSDLRLVAVYSRSLKSAESLTEAVPDVRLYSDDSGEGKGFDGLMAQKDVDAVMIGYV
jgi:hypothetical protein